MVTYPSILTPVEEKKLSCRRDIALRPHKPHIAKNLDSSGYIFVVLASATLTQLAPNAAYCVK